MKEAPALQTETRAGTVFAWHRKAGDWAIRLGDRVPCCWPKTGEGNVARLTSAVLVANDKLGTDFTEDEAREIGQRLAKRVRKGVRYTAAKFARR